MLQKIVLVGIALVLASPALAQEQSGFAESGGARIFYRVLGDGAPILLINGGPGWSSDHMLPVARKLSETHRAILFDQRGTGKSELATLDSTTITMDAMVEDIEALREHLGFGNWTVMGHSFGGMLSMAYAAEHPEPIDALILSAPAGPNTDFLAYYPASLNDRLLPHEQDAVAYWSDPDRIAAMPETASYELARATIGGFLFDRSRLPEMLAVLDKDTWSISTSNRVWADLSRIAFDVREPLSAFDRPVLVVQGRQDALGDHHAQQVSDVFPQAKLLIIEESAHIMWLDQEERYFSAISDFLGGLQ